MNKKKKYIFISFVALLILVTSFLFLNFNNKKELPVTILSEQNYINDGLNKKTQTEILVPKKEEEENLPASIDIKNIKIILNILNKTYTVNIKDGATVYDAMNSIQDTKENNFSFKAKEYSSLGVFVDEINGVKGTSGKYWIYYVNDKEASIGISKYILKSGDIISWKQE